MKSYKYRCAVCTCLFKIEEVQPFYCAMCNEILAKMGHYDSKQVVGYLCRLCKKNIRTQKKLEQALQPILKVHIEEEHASVELV